jgi:hypothetical protein
MLHNVTYHTGAIKRAGFSVHGGEVRLTGFAG